MMQSLWAAVVFVVTASILRFEDGNSAVTDVESSWYELSLKLQIRHFDFLLFTTCSCIYT